MCGTYLVCFSSWLINAYYRYSLVLQMSPAFIWFVNNELQLYSCAQQTFSIGKSLCIETAFSTQSYLPPVRRICTKKMSTET